MKILPAIDIKDGKCVRLLQGDYSKITNYNENSPVEQAVLWQEQGAEILHIVDLDGAKTGSHKKNFNIIKNIIDNINIPVEIGGGIRTIHTVNEYINIGVKYIILGTAAVKNPNFLKICLNKYPDNITVGIDAKNDFVSTDGWTENSKLNFIEFAKQVVNKGCKRIIYTDIARDGMLSSPNYDNLKKLAESVNCEIIASGGVSCIDDIKKLIELNIPNITGVITGKALYEKKILLKDAVKLI